MAYSDRMNRDTPHSCLGGEVECLAKGCGSRLAGLPCAIPVGMDLHLNTLDKYRAMEIDGYPWHLTQIRSIRMNYTGVPFKVGTQLGISMGKPCISAYSLPVYQVRQDKWQRLPDDAQVNRCRDAWVRIVQAGDYGFFKTADWTTMTYSGITLVYRQDGIPFTLIYNPIIIASGKRTDEAVIQAVMDVTGRDRAGAIELLLSYDTTGSNIVQVYQSNQPLTVVVRYWGPVDKLGRWYGAQEMEDALLLPDEAISDFALPLGNNAQNTTMYQFKEGLKLIYGVCADMRWNPIFGPTAFGGGLQFYATDSTVFVVDHVELNPVYCKLLSELRHVIS